VNYVSTMWVGRPIFRERGESNEEREILVDFSDGVEFCFDGVPAKCGLGYESPENNKGRTQIHPRGAPQK